MKSNLNLINAEGQPDWAYSLTEIRLIANAVIKQISPRYKVSHVGRCNWDNDEDPPSYILMVDGIGVVSEDIEKVKRELETRGFDTELFFAIVNSYEVM